MEWNNSTYITSRVVQLVNVKATHEILFEVEQRALVHGLDNLMGELATKSACHVLDCVDHGRGRRQTPATAATVHTATKDGRVTKLCML